MQSEGRTELPAAGRNIDERGTERARYEVDPHRDNEQAETDVGERAVAIAASPHGRPKPQAERDDRQGDEPVLSDAERRAVLGSFRNRERGAQKLRSLPAGGPKPGKGWT